MYHEIRNNFVESWMSKKAKTGWDISVEITEYFKDYCSACGQPLHKAQEAAMLIWTFLPAEVQRLALFQAGGKIPKLDESFWKEFLNKLGIESIFDTQSPSEKPKKR